MPIARVSGRLSRIRRDDLNARFAMMTDFYSPKFVIQTLEPPERIEAVSSALCPLLEAASVERKAER